MEFSEVKIKEIYEILKECKGPKNAMVSSKIAKIVNIKPGASNVKIRKYIREVMKRYRLPLGSHGRGYYIVENTEERKIGTNITGKGHIIICPIPIGGTGALICYINPKVGPRDALFTAQEYALKLANFV